MYMSLYEYFKDVVEGGGSGGGKVLDGETMKSSPTARIKALEEGK